MKKWNWKNLLPPPMLVALLFASCNLIQEMPQDFVETYGNIAYVEKVDYVGLAENVESGEKPKVTETKNFKIIYSIRNDGNFDLSPEFAFEGCQIKNPHVDTEKKRVSLTVPGEELKALADGADFKVKLTLYKASQKVLQSAYELDMRYVYTGGPEIPKGKVEIKIPGLDLPDGYKVDLKNETADFKVEQADDGSWVVKTTEGGVSEGKHELELVVKDEDGKVLKDGDGNDITITIEVDVSAGSTTSGFTEKDDEKSLDDFIDEVEKKIEEIGKTPPEESKNPTTEPETPKGKVEVKVEVPDGYELVLDGKDKDKFEVVDNNDGSWSIKSTGDGLPEDEYDIKLVVKDEEENEVKEFDKKIEVFAEKTTDKFTDDDETPFVITEEMIEKTTVYVRGTNAAWYDDKHKDDAKASDTNSGARLHPFATIQKAIDTVIERNKQDENEYTIYIDGTLTQSAAPSDGKDGMADFSDLNESLTLTIKALSGTATLDADGKSRVINASPNGGTLKLTLENLVIKGGKAAVDGGGIFVANGTMLTMNGTITGNTARQGGGVYVIGDKGVFTMTGGEISDNHAIGEVTSGTGKDSIAGGGIFIYSGGKANISDTTISGNTANNNGGGIHVNGGTLNIDSGAIISGNEAKKDGGGVYVNDIFNMDGGTIFGNTAQQDGGGVYVSSGTFNMSDGAIGGENTANTAQNGGGVYVANNGTFTLTGGEISSNKAIEGDLAYNGQGGGVYVNSATFEISGTAKIIGNTATDSGGGIYVYKDRADENARATLKMNGGTISGNIAKQDGGGIYNKGGEFAMSNGTINGGNKATFGGGVYIGDNGKFIMNYGEISGNKAESETTTLSGGGGVNVNNGTFEMYDGKISGNEAKGTTNDSGGGGVYVYQNNTFTMRGGTIGDNNQAAYGGGVYVNSATFSMSGSAEINGNKASKGGGGVFVNSATFSMSDTAKVNRNIADESGGGIYVWKYLSDATFSMAGGEISGNTATNNNGGGIYNQGGKLTIHSGTITNNTANNDGGGVYIASGSFNMKKGIISNNTAPYGSGVYITNTGEFIMDDVKIIDNLTGNGVWSKGTFVMNDGTISGHSVSGKGGGVYAAGGSFTMNGGTISRNSAGTQGNGAYIDNTFNMSGDAQFDKNNDVYLCDTKTIIVGALNKDYVATITPNAYPKDNETRQVLSGTVTDGICKKFLVTPDGDTKWKVVPNGSTAGVLKKDEVSTGGGISVTVPGVGSYTFKFEEGSNEIVEGSKLSFGTSIKFSEVKDSSGKVLTSSDGDFSIEIRDEGENTLTSATGFQCAVAVPVVPPIGMKLQIYAKVVLKSGIVIIDNKITVIGP